VPSELPPGCPDAHPVRTFADIDLSIRRDYMPKLNPLSFSIDRVEHHAARERHASGARRKNATASTSMCFSTSATVTNPASPSCSIPEPLCVAASRRLWCCKPRCLLGLVGVAMPPL